MVPPEKDRVVAWGSFATNGSYSGSEARTLLPQGLFVELGKISSHFPPFLQGEDVDDMLMLQDLTSRDPDGWSFLRWMYNRVIYKSADELRLAMRDPGFEKLPLNADGQWTRIEDFSRGPPGRELPPPAMVQPSGSRYSLDRKANYVFWSKFVKPR